MSGRANCIGYGNQPECLKNTECYWRNGGQTRKASCSLRPIRTKKGPTEFNLLVKQYMGQHGVSLPEASTAVSRTYTKKPRAGQFRTNPLYRPKQVGGGVIDHVVNLTKEEQIKDPDSDMKSGAYNILELLDYAFKNAGWKKKDEIYIITDEGGMLELDAKTIQQIRDDLNNYKEKGIDDIMEAIDQWSYTENPLMDWEEANEIYPEWTEAIDYPYISIPRKQRGGYFGY